MAESISAPTGEPQRPPTTSALPVSNARFAWWLFLSVNGMLLAGVLGAYVVLRSAVPIGDWPAPAWVKNHWCIGMVIIGLLLAICVCLINATRSIAAARSTEATRHRPWRTFAFVLAMLAIGTIGLDYLTKISHGYYPHRQHPMVFGNANLSYLTAVSARVDDWITQLETVTGSDPTHAAELERWRFLRDGHIDWTRRKFGKTDDRVMKELSLRLFANEIFPTQSDSRLSQFRQDEMSEVQQLLQAAELELSEIDSADEAIAEVTRTQRNRLTQRLDFLEATSDPERQSPILSSMRKRLPKVIPAGPTWLATYWLLTGFMMIQLAAGTVLLSLTLKNRSTNDQPIAWDLLQNVTAFWYFTTATGIIVAVLVYFV